MILAIIIPNTYPITPPVTVITTPSTKNSRFISFLLAPIDLFIPISKVLSETEV